MRRHLPNRQHPLFVTPGLLLIVVSFASGICLAGSCYLSEEYLVPFITILLLLLFVIRKCKPQRYQSASYFLLALLFMLLGFYHAERDITPPPNATRIYSLIETKETVSLDTNLVQYPSVIHSPSGPVTRMLMQVNNVLQSAAREPPTLKSTKASDLVLLSMNGLLPENVKPGNRLLIRAKLSRPTTYATPGAFDYTEYLARRAIYFTGWIQTPSNILQLRTDNASRSATIISLLHYLPERIRYNLGTTLDKTLPQPARGLYKAILIGDRNDVPAGVLENFTTAGCIHILAISGMHMGLLALVAIGIFTWLLKRSPWLLLHTSVRKIGTALALLPLLLYALIAGFNIPVIRALLMTVVFMLAILFDRPENLINHIFVAALLILLWKPAAIFSASFQLSFSAVLTIALIYPLFYRFLFPDARTTTFYAAATGTTAQLYPVLVARKLLFSILQWVLTAIALTTAAMLGTFPLLLFHFNRLPLVAPLANLLVEPLICFWSLIIGLAASMSLPFSPALAKFLFTAGGFGLTGAANICAFFAALEHGSLWLPTPTPLTVILIYMTLLTIVMALHLSGKRRRYALTTALVFFCTLLTVFAVTTITERRPGPISVTILDVGHGASILLRLPGDKNILIDGGGAEGERFNIGSQVIAPFLWHQGISHLDAVVITHPHADHYNGLPFILRRFHPGTLWINGKPGPDKGYKALLESAAQLNIATRIPTADDILFQAGSTCLLCLFSGREESEAPRDFSRHEFINANDLSIVLRLDTDTNSFLFPGDISAGLAERLIKEGRNFKADVLMAPHHGSPASMSQDFIASVAPAYVAISAGRNNPFNFPAKSFYDLRQRGIKVFSTDRDGTITFSLQKEGLVVRRYLIN